MNDSAGFIYFLKESLTGTIKVGYSKRLDKRIFNFGVTLPFDIELIHVIFSLNVKHTEKLFHVYFKKKRVNGEWFRLTDSDILNIRQLKLPEHILRSINFNIIRKPKIYNIDIHQMLPIKFIKVNKHFKSSETKLANYIKKLSEGEDMIVKVSKGKNKDEFILHSSPYVIAAMKELHENFVWAEII